MSAGGHVHLLMGVGRLLHHMTDRSDKYRGQERTPWWGPEREINVFPRYTGVHESTHVNRGNSRCPPTPAAHQSPSMSQRKGCAEEEQEHILQTTHSTNQLQFVLSNVLLPIYRVGVQGSRLHCKLFTEAYF